MRHGRLALFLLPLLCTAAAPERTGRQLDLAIDGDGFFPVRDRDHLAYTRNGNFFVSPVGLVVTAAGLPLDPPLVVPPGTASLSILPNGSVHVRLRLRGDTQTRALRPIQLATFPHPEALRRDGGLLTATPAAGQPATRTPGRAPAGRLLQGFLEPAPK